MRPIYLAFGCFFLLWGSISCESYFEPEEREQTSLEVVSVYPPMNARNIPLDAAIRIKLNKHLDRNAFSTSSLDLRSGDSGKWKMAYYNPLDMELVVWASRPLLPNTVWNIYFVNEVQALDGSHMATRLVTRFQTGDEELKTPVFENREYFSDVKPILDSRCAHCHGQRNFAGLDLQGETGICRTAVHVPSTGWPGMDRISLDRPGASYLVYKLLDNGNVAGEVMPRRMSGIKVVAPLTNSEKRIIVDWISSGAIFGEDVENESEVNK
ncbi:MAG: Ig-like domain-containing protein [Deltaproteobacteria bacterium]|nr:Ig-like domain-containing protein [Deltaproteobacteria bacterium]